MVWGNVFIYYRWYIFMIVLKMFRSNQCVWDIFQVDN